MLSHQNKVRLGEFERRPANESGVARFLDVLEENDLLRAEVETQRRVAEAAAVRADSYLASWKQDAALRVVLAERDEAHAALRALVDVDDRSKEIYFADLGHPFEHPNWVSAHTDAWGKARQIVLSHATAAEVQDA